MTQIVMFMIHLYNVILLHRNPHIVLYFIVLDKNHEQLNQIIKGDGGAVGITENPLLI